MPTSQLLLPPPGLADRVFAGIFRDTRGAGLCDRDRVNHFPASPLVSVTRVIHGSLRVFTNQPDGIATQHLSATHCPVLVLGPQSAPMSSDSPDDVTAITVGFFYDAWLRLGGDPSFGEVPRWVVDLTQPFCTGLAPERQWEAFCDRLQDVCAREGAPQAIGASRIASWVQSVVARAALTGPGRSLRSFERRLKRLSGQNRQALEYFAAFENLHRTVSAASGETPSQIAVAAGYSDQSHMGRAVRRATGFSPVRLNRAIQTEEAFWCYRLLGERF